jgi:hypothetical protein
METFHIFLNLMLDFVSKSSGEFLAAMAGAFFGAACAFWFERSKEKEKKQAEEHGALMRSQLALICQLNTINNIRKQHLDPFRNDPIRERNMIQFRMTDASLRVAYDSISFLLMTKNPTLVLDVQAAEHSYISAMECLAWRNEAYEKLHNNSKLEKIDVQTGRCTVQVDLRDIKQLKDLTDALYTSVDNAYDRIELQIQELYKAGKLLYPKKNFLQIAGEK